MPLYTARNSLDADLRDAPIHDDGTPTNTLVIDAPDPDLARRALATHLWTRGRLSAARLVTRWTITPAVSVLGPRRAPERPNSTAYVTDHLTGAAREAADAIVAFLRAKTGRALRSPSHGPAFWTPEAWNAAPGRDEVRGSDAVLVLHHSTRSTGGDLAFLNDEYDATDGQYDLTEAIEARGFYAEIGFDFTIVYRAGTLAPEWDFDADDDTSGAQP